MESSSSWKQDLFHSDHNKAVDELVRGQEFAEQLRKVLTNPVKNPVENPDVKPISPGYLLTRIYDSFTNSLSLLRNGGHSSDQSVEVSQIPSKFRRKSEDSDDSFNKSTVTETTSIRKDKRGCYKRRKNSHTWIKDDTTLVDDGHAWRKYGQKPILNSKHPRNYFRCTHRVDQGCQATKQVQIIQDNPTLFRTTYFGNHTCKNILHTPASTITSHEHDDSSVFLSFGNNSVLDDHHCREYHYNNRFMSSSPSSVLVKQQVVDDDPTANNHSLSFPYMLSSASDPIAIKSSGCSSSYNSDCLDLEHLMVGSVDFGDDLEFDF